LRRPFLSWRQIPILSYNCRGGSSPLISIVLGLADRPLSFLHINICRGGRHPEYTFVMWTRISLDRTTSNRCHRGTSTFTRIIAVHHLFFCLVAKTNIIFLSRDSRSISIDYTRTRSQHLAVTLDSTSDLLRSSGTRSSRI